MVLEKISTAISSRSGMVLEGRRRILLTLDRKSSGCLQEQTARIASARKTI
jgi:hypothetical protein